jgi:AraC family transcriptional regulator of adaptative response / DNA-3-methyladenine glycosylase II
LDLAPGIGLQQAVEQLKTVRGIGDWTAHYIALRALRFPDAFPSGDLGLQKALAKQLGQEKVSATQLQLEAEKWSPWRGYAALLLWQSLSQNP